MWVYASIIKDDCSAEMTLITTYKPFFDRCESIDDGTSNSDTTYPDPNPYSTIDSAMKDMGLVETSRSHYKIPDTYDITDVEEMRAVLIEAAKDRGINLIFAHEPFDNIAEG